MLCSNCGCACFQDGEECSFYCNECGWSEDSGNGAELKD